MCPQPNSAEAGAPLPGYNKAIIFGIVGLFIPFVAPVAVILGIKALKKHVPKEARAFRVTTIISLIFGIIGSTVLFIFLIMFFPFSEPTAGKKYDNAVAYQIFKAEDISYPGNKRMNYRIVVSPEIKKHQVGPTVKTIIADIIAKDNDIDDICLWLYSDRELAFSSAYDVAMALWTPDGMTIDVKENLEK